MTATLPRETALWIAFDRAHNILARHIHNKMAEVELTAPQYGVLRRLGDSGPQTLGTLALDMGVTPGNLTGVVDRLESAGWLERARQEDRRFVQLRLTPQGERKYAQAVPAMRAQVRALFSPLSPAEMGSLQEMLARLEAHMTTPEVSA